MIKLPDDIESLKAIVLEQDEQIRNYSDLLSYHIDRQAKAETEVQRLNATAQMDMSERDSTKNLKWLFDLSKACHVIGTPVRLSDSQVENIFEAFQELEQRLNATAQPVSDGWVKCSDRMPEEMSDVLVTDRKDVKDMWWNGKKWDSWADRYSLDSNSISHWMPKPAAPGGQDD